MARNGSGVYNIYTPGNPVVTGTTISSTAFNNTINDIATALTGSISADGQTPITANIPMNSHKLTGLAAPTVAGDALSYGGVVAGSIGAFTSSALGTQVIATNGGTTTLTVSSPYYTVFTGTFVQTVVLPDATTLTLGQRYGIDNDGSLAITVKTNGGATLWTIASGCDLYLTLTAQATAVGVWETDYQGAQVATGKTLVVNNSVTVNGTDATTITLPTTSATLARTDASNTFTGAQTFNSTIVTNGATSGSVTLQATAIAGSTVLTLPATTGTVLTTGTTVTEAQGGTGTTTGYYGFKNRIINGAMVIDQRNAGASVTQSTTTIYTVDRWSIYGSAISKFTLQQQTSIVPVGFTNAIKATSSSAYSVTSTDEFDISQYIEGYNIADFGWGTANAQTVTLSFKVYSSLTGTFGGQIANYNSSRSYPFSYSIPVANTWTTISVTIAGDTTGTWQVNNTAGMLVLFSMGAGSTKSGTANTWQAGNFTQPTGSVSVVGTSGATFYITGVQLEKGSTATSFDYRPYGTELSLCQRYFIGGQFYNGTKTASGYTRINVPLSATMRTTPALVYADSVGNVSKISTNASNDTKTNNRTPVVVTGSSPSMVQIFPNNTDADTGYEVYISCSSEL